MQTRHFLYSLLLQVKKLIKRIHRIFAIFLKELSHNSLTPAVRGEPHHLPLHDTNLGSPPTGVQTTISTDVPIDFNNVMNCPDNLFLLQLYIKINTLDRNVQKRSKNNGRQLKMSCDVIKSDMFSRGQ